MITPSDVRMDNAQRYVFVKSTTGRPITYVSTEDVYRALRNLGIGYNRMVSDEMSAKAELLNELRENPW